MKTTKNIPQNHHPYAEGKTSSVWKSSLADALRITQDNLNSKNFYAFNPSFDKGCSANIFKNK